MSISSMKFVGDLRKEFAGYNAVSLSKDLMAGLTVAAVALPLALAFGVSSGADAAAGLITAIIAGLLIGALSGASYQISGPTGAMTAILAGLAARHGLQGVFIAGFLSGCVLLVAGILRVGALVSFIPGPVITGFTSGIAVIIALGQIDNFFGTVSIGENALQKLASYGELGFHPSLYAILFGVLVIGVMLIWPKKWNARFPSSLVGIIVALVVQLVGNFPVEEVGAIPRTLLPEARLTFSLIPWARLGEFAAPAISIAALGMVESLLCGASAGKMKDEKLDAGRELVAQGIGNMVIPFFGGVPATAAIARTSVAIKSGGRTRLTSVFHSVGLLCSMFFLGPVMSRIPLAALAGVLIVTAWRMNEWAAIRQIFNRRIKTSIAQFLVTMLATVMFDLTSAILIGIGLSMLLFVVRSRDVRIEVVEPTLSMDDKRTRVVYIDGALFFATQDKLPSLVDDLIMKGCRRIVFSLRGVPSIDHSEVSEITAIVRQCQAKGVDVLFAGLQPPVQRMFERLSLDELVGKNQFYSSAVVALEVLGASSATDGAEQGLPSGR
ncbi:MAG: SulP family inorganic anion transporter [Sphaerochaetaceae bacterium]|nr:SulP family inorganic anion transporter [Sphaerochaetaceae bacterium]